MTLIRWNPWNDISSLHGQMDELFTQALTREGGRDLTEYATLPVDIRQTDSAYMIEASVPGFTPEQVEITFEDGVLTIRGDHRTGRDGAKDGYVRRERRIASFQRQVGLPAEVRADDITADYENGVLTVTVPRAEKPQPKRIPVTAARKGAAARVVDAVKAGSKT